MNGMEALLQDIEKEDTEAKNAEQKETTEQTLLALTEAMKDITARLDAMEKPAPAPAAADPEPPANPEPPKE